ncbi:unnamed protein product [Cunninghamella blakesleeana]
MIQTTPSNKFNNNSLLQPTINKVLHQEKEEEEKEFHVVLVDIKNTHDTGTIKCVKKNMYDIDLKYIAISYRWGELNVQYVETPDYTAHITSFGLYDLRLLGLYIGYEPDLKDIRYLWIDAISIDQQNHTRKKETILQMSQIYKRASYILAIPDLHTQYLCKYPANKEIINLLKYKYNATIRDEIVNNKHSSSTNPTKQQHTNNDETYSFIQKLKNEKVINEIERLKIENEELKMKMKEIQMEMEEIKWKQEKDEIKKIYQFLAYLVDDWSNRAWVISEYHIAKQKYKNHRTPLKYWFISLVNYGLRNQFFFSYPFDDDMDAHQQQCTEKDENDDNNNKILTYQEVDNIKTFHRFLKSRFMQRSHLKIILSSNTTRNEDRFNAILPSWNEYKHHIKNVLEWNITDMTSVRLKLYEIMNLWDKATLLYACTGYDNYLLPSFACRYNADKLRIVEKCNCDNDIYKEFEEKALKEMSCYITGEVIMQIQQLINDYKTHSKPLWAENLTSIQLKQSHRCLSVKSNSYFLRNEKPYGRFDCQNKLSLDDKDDIDYAFIPFFISTLPGFMDESLVYEYSSSIYLVGNKDKNKWMLTNGKTDNYELEHFCSDDYIFNIY